MFPLQYFISARVSFKFNPNPFQKSGDKQGNGFICHSQLGAGAGVCIIMFFVFAVGPFNVWSSNNWIFRSYLNVAIL